MTDGGECQNCIEHVVSVCSHLPSRVQHLFGSLVSIGFYLAKKEKMSVNEDKIKILCIANSYWARCAGLKLGCKRDPALVLQCHKSFPV